MNVTLLEVQQPDEAERLRDQNKNNKLLPSKTEKDKNLTYKKRMLKFTDPYLSVIMATYNINKLKCRKNEKKKYGKKKKIKQQPRRILATLNKKN